MANELRIPRGILPTIDALTSELKGIRDALHHWEVANTDDDAEGWTDVRLIAGRDFHSEEWTFTLNTGDPSYDQWHGEACASDSVKFDYSNRQLRSIARNLLADVHHVVAQLPA